MLLDLDVVWWGWLLCWGLCMVYSDFPLLDLWLGFGLGLLNKYIMRYNGNKNVWVTKLFDLFFLFCILFQWVLKGLWLISRLRGSWYLLRWKMDPSLLWLVTVTLVTSPAHWLITVSSDGFMMSLLIFALSCHNTSPAISPLIVNNEQLCPTFRGVTFTLRWRPVRV